MLNMQDETLEKKITLKAMLSAFNFSAVQNNYKTGER